MQYHVTLMDDSPLTKAESLTMDEPEVLRALQANNFRITRIREFRNGSVLVYYDSILMGARILFEPLRYGMLDCDNCGELVALFTNPRDLVLVLCGACNHGTPIR